MRIPRIGAGLIAPILPATAEPQPRDAARPAEPAPQGLALLLPRPHRHGLAAKRRLAGRKRGDADGAHVADPSGESEDLLLMLEQHLRRDERGVQKVAARNPRGGYHPSQHDEHGAELSTGRRTTGEEDAAYEGQALPPMRLVQRAPRDESTLLTQWRSVAGARTPARRAEQALLAVAAAARDTPAAGGVARPAAPASPTYSILAIVREFLSLPQAERGAPATLAEVRDRLLAASAGAAPLKPARPLSEAEESANLLLPIVLLNLGRQRTRAGGAIGIASLAALIRRGRGW